MTPKISVVIPSYNSAEWLGETIDSVAAQVGVAYEIIVVDDGSTDSTPELVARYPAVRYLQQSNAGVAAARNTGIRASKGSYVALLDSDDIWVPDKLQRQAQILDRYESVGLVFSNYSPFGAPVAYRTGLERSGVLATLPRRAVGNAAYILQSDGLFFALLKDLFPWTSSLLIRKSALDAVGPLYERLRHVGEDWLMCLQLSKVCEFAFIDDCLVHRREHANSNSRIGHHEAQAALALEHLCDWNHLLDDERRAVKQMLANVLFDLGYHELTRGDVRSARSRFEKYFALVRSMAPAERHRAKRPRAAAYFASTWLPAGIVKFLASMRAGS